MKRHIEPLWIRFDYRLGTDERHEQLLMATGDCRNVILDHDSAVTHDDFSAILAFEPVLVELRSPLYDDDEVE